MHYCHLFAKEGKFVVRIYTEDTAFLYHLADFIMETTLEPVAFSTVKLKNRPIQLKRTKVI